MLIFACHKFDTPEPDMSKKYEWVDAGVFGNNGMTQPVDPGGFVFRLPSGSWTDGVGGSGIDYYRSDSRLNIGDAVEANHIKKLLRAKEKPRQVGDTADVSDGNFDPVNRPAHYQHKSGYQPIHFMEHMEFPNLTHAFKYLARRALKGSESLDMDKGIWFVERHLAGPEKEFDELDIDAFVEDEPTPVGRMLRALFIGDDDEIEDALPALKAYAGRRKAATK